MKPRREDTDSSRRHHEYYMSEVCASVQIFILKQFTMRRKHFIQEESRKKYSKFTMLYNKVFQIYQFFTYFLLVLFLVLFRYSELYFVTPARLLQVF